MSAPRHGFLRANALSLVFGALFLVTLAGQATVVPVGDPGSVRRPGQVVGVDDSAEQRRVAELAVASERTGLDLAVIAAEWGYGRRQGRLSNIHLAARDADSGELVMLGKTFKGMTDAMLVWQT